MIPALVLPDGRRLELDDDIVLGRAPVAPESSQAARPIILSVPTVSKTHALIGHDASGVWLVDLYSSNGSEVLDAAGASEQAVPGQRTSVPAGSHIRVGTDAIITIDSGVAPGDDDLDRTVVVRPAPALPVPPTVAEVADPTDAVDRPPQPPSPPQQQPPTPSQQPPAPPPAAPTQAILPAPANSFPPVPDQQPVPDQHPAPSYGSGAVHPSDAPPAAGRSVAQLIGALIVLVWSAVGFADLRGWVPDSVGDSVDGRLLGFFFVPNRAMIELFEFYSVLTLPESLSFLSRGADIGPVVAVVVASVCLVFPNRAVRWTLAVLIAIPLVLLLGFLVTVLVDQFDDTVDLLDRFIPWFVLPGIGSVLLVWPKRRPATAPTPPQDVFYAPGQSPEPPFSGPGAPPFS